MKKHAILLFTVLLLSAGCRDPLRQEGQNREDVPPPEAVNTILRATRPHSNPVQKINFTGNNNTLQISLDGLENHSVFLVKVNTSSQNVTHNATGHAFKRRSRSEVRFLDGFPVMNTVNRNLTERNTAEIPQRNHRGAERFNANPPPFNPPRALSRNVTAAPLSFTVGGQRKFWVEDKNGNWTEIYATLSATSEHSNIWVANDNWDIASDVNNDNKLNQSQTQSMADNFDLIYRYTTAIFGYEFGGGIPPTHNDFGGIDGDPKIQILVYDIDFDFGDDSRTSVVLGYFWAKDMYDQAFLDNSDSDLRSNKAEIFYIDSEWADKTPARTYSTLVHEFQHMINFNEKYLKTGRISSVWYNEMLSLLAEDIISPLIGIPENYRPVKERIPLFLGAYDTAGVTEWRQDTVSYSNVFAFGAYLARNFGGANFVKDVALNDQIDVASLNLALQNHRTSFTQALSRYGEALIFSGVHKPVGVNSFDRMITQNINNTHYTFYDFDIWNMTHGEGFGNGPVVWNLDWVFSMPPHSIIVQSFDEWQGVTGRLEMTAQRPTNSAVDLYLMIR